MNKFEQRFQEEMFEERLKSEMSAQSKSPTNEPYEFSPVNMVKNAPQSFGNLAGNLVNAAAHPVDTGKAMYKVGVGAYNKFTPGIQPEEKIIDAIGADYAKSYKPTNTGHGIGAHRAFSQVFADNENFLRTLEGDPARALSDLSALGSLGGSVASTLPGKAGAIGKQLKNTALAVDPINMAVNASKVGGKALLNTKYFKNTPVNMLKSSAKFGTVLDKGLNPHRRDDLAKTMIKHQIMPTQKGLAKASDEALNLQKDVDNIVNAWTQSGKRLPIKKIVSEGNKKIRKYGKPGVNDSPLADANRAQSTMDNWKDPMAGIDTMTPNDMQNLKRNLYKKVNYNTLNKKAKDLPIEETRKAMARGAKETIETLDPNLKGMNKDLGNLLDLSDPLTQSVGRIQNRDLLGIGIPIKVLAGETVLPGGGGAAIGLFGGLLDDPLNKAWLGLQMGKIQSAPIGGLLSDNSLKGILIRKAMIEAERAKQR